MTNKIIILVVLLLSTQTFPQKKSFTIADIYKVKNAAGISVSPDNRTLLFLLTESNMEKGTTNSDIYTLSSDGKILKNITNTTFSESNPVWSKDGKEIFFTSSNSGTNQLYKIYLEDGKKEQITDFSSGINDYKFSPEFNLLAFNTDVYPECGADSECNKKNIPMFH